MKRNLQKKKYIFQPCANSPRINTALSNFQLFPTNRQIIKQFFLLLRLLRRCVEEPPPIPLRSLHHLINNLIKKKVKMIQHTHSYVLGFLRGVADSFVFCLLCGDISILKLLFYIVQIFL